MRNFLKGENLKKSLPILPWFTWLRRMVLGLLVLVILFWLWMGVGEMRTLGWRSVISLLPAVILMAAFWLVLRQPGWGATLLIGFGVGFPTMEWLVNGWPIGYVLTGWMFYTPPLALGIALMIGVQLARDRRK